MPSDESKQQRGKIATYCFGTPTLIGAILITLTIGSPGSAPARNAATMTPIGVGLILLGGIGGIAYWARSRKDGLSGGRASGSSLDPKGALARQVKHSVTFMPAATDKVRRIFAKKPDELKRLIVCIAQPPGRQPAIELSLDQSLLTSPLHAAAISNGTLVVIARQDIERFADLVVDFREGFFQFEGSAVPPLATASDPGELPLSRKMLLALNPTLVKDRDAVDRIARHLQKGDRCAAVVVSVKPLVVAAYSSEIDAVALLRFPETLVALHSLQRGTRLVTLNTYDDRPGLVSDLVHGEHSYHRYSNFSPVIGNFLSEDSARLEWLERGVTRREWDRTLALIADALRRAGGRFRDGCPPNVTKPAY